MITNTFPMDIWGNIFKFLPSKELARNSTVCLAFKEKIDIIISQRIQQEHIWLNNKEITDLCEKAPGQLKLLLRFCIVFDPFQNSIILKKYDIKNLTINNNELDNVDEDDEISISEIDIEAGIKTLNQKIVDETNELNVSFGGPGLSWANYKGNLIQIYTNAINHLKNTYPNDPRAEADIDDFSYSLDQIQIASYLTGNFALHYHESIYDELNVILPPGRVNQGIYGAYNSLINHYLDINELNIKKTGLKLLGQPNEEKFLTIVNKAKKYENEAQILNQLKTLKILLSTNDGILTPEISKILSTFLDLGFPFCSEIVAKSSIDFDYQREREAFEQIQKSNSLQFLEDNVDEWINYYNDNDLIEFSWNNLVRSIKRFLDPNLPVEQFEN